MTIDEIATALQEWRDDDEDRHYMLIAIDADEDATVAMQGGNYPLGYALATAMRTKPFADNTVQYAMILKERDELFDDNDHDKAGTK